MSGIHALVFTKDRPLQLDAFLRSAKKYAPYDLIRICDTSGAAFEQYVRLFLAQHERVVFHTDDDVFFRRISADHSHRQDAVRSFRLGRNTLYQHTTGRRQRVPSNFPWRWHNAEGDFGYPLCLNATVYRSADLLPLLDFHFDNPTSLEAQLAAKADEFAPEWMTAPLHSCCVSIPYNRVTTGSRNPISDNPAHSAEALQALWDEGYRLDLDAMDFSSVIGAHQVIEPRFYRV